MKKANESAAVVVPREHQSAPKEHWADEEVRKAAEEIRTGQFTPDVDEDDLLAVGVQRGQLPNNPNEIDMNSTLDSLALAQHPRVIAALAKLEQEKREAKNPQEVLEKTQMLYELNEAASATNKWNGQERWQGKEAEEMRIGQIFNPLEFMQRLKKVIGNTRVFLNQFAVLNRVALLVKDDAPAPLIIMPGMPEPRKDGMVQVGTLQWPCSTEWMIMRFDEYGVPTTAKYLGWRTALLSMIQLGVITEKEAHKAFPLSLGPAGNWYREQLQVIRSQKGTVN